MKMEEKNEKERNYDKRTLNLQVVRKVSYDVCGIKIVQDSDYAYLILQSVAYNSI